MEFEPFISDELALTMVFFLILFVLLGYRQISN